ncbi:MAG: PPOX class F420-dependent oxidoreductase [Deltaproteobacteria bacterium]|nr:PPOX class F420-dependent oxidoreductase [Deltaproteobacteria bacterium]
MTFLHPQVPCPRRQLRSFTLHLFLCMTFFLSVVSSANAVEPKPAQRKRHGGIKPFTTEQINDFLSERRNATIATLNKNGAPQLTPVVFYWDGSTFYISVTKETIKYKNLKRDPRISLVVDDVLGHHCVIATGKATIQEEDVWPMTEKIMYKYYGPEEGAPYVEQLKKQNRVLIVLKPTKMQAWGSVPRDPSKP